MTQLFDKARQSIISENEAFAPQKKQYEETMEMVRTCVENVVDIETANVAAETIRGFEHALTSKREASVMLKAKTDSLGLKYSKEAGSYILKDGGQ